MKKKKICPPGQLCIGSNFLITVLVFVIIILLFYLLRNNLASNTFLTLNKQNESGRECSKKFLDLEKTNIQKSPRKNNVHVESNRHGNVESDRHSHNDNDAEGDTNIVIKFQPESEKTYLVNKDHERVVNPLLPPERRNHYIDPHSHVMVSPGVPINIPTRGESGGFQQVGVLHKIDTSDETMQIGNNNEPVILPLMGAPTYNGSHKWTYYTATDKYNQIKLPITNKNRKCDSEYGCDELYDEDNVTIPAYNGSFKVKKYDFDKPRYLPFVV
jgi:hypothetical protein